MRLAHDGHHCDAARSAHRLGTKPAGARCRPIMQCPDCPSEQHAWMASLSSNVLRGKRVAARNSTHWGMRMARYSSGTAVMISTSFGALASAYLYEACMVGRHCQMSTMYGHCRRVLFGRRPHIPFDGVQVHVLPVLHAPQHLGHDLGDGLHASLNAQMYTSMDRARCALHKGSHECRLPDLLWWKYELAPLVPFAAFVRPCAAIIHNHRRWATTTQPLVLLCHVEHCFFLM